MAKDRVTTVSEAVHKLQVALLDGIHDDSQLFAAGLLISRGDYEDVVTERSISNLCGYPLCPNSLPSAPSRKGRYRISLKEHKVYDLHETYLYCCSSCLINSRAFAGSLQEERCSVLNPVKINEILRLFKNEGLETEEEREKSGGDLGICKLRIQENVETKGGEVSMEEWIGPSNAIEGYVPQRDRQSKPTLSKTPKQDSVLGNGKSNLHNDTVQNEIEFEVAIKPNEDSTSAVKVRKDGKISQLNHSERLEPLLSDMNFSSAIITNDEYIVSKKSVGSSKPVFSGAGEGSKQKISGSKKGKESIFGTMDFMSTIITEDEYNISKLPCTKEICDPNQLSGEFSKKLDLGGAGKQFKHSEETCGPSENVAQSSGDSVVIEAENTRTENASLAKVSFRHNQNDASSSSGHIEDGSHTEQRVNSGKTMPKSSLKTSGVRKAARSVTWADEKLDGLVGGNLCEIREFKNAKGTSTLRSKEAGDTEDPQRFASAEACAIALCQAAEAVASGQSDANDAFSEVGITLLPQPESANEGEQPVECDALEDTAPVKWPKKPGNLNSDFFDSEDSWFDAPPEGFSLTLSPFAMMWNALFSWMTSSSLAYIYGRDESFHEEYMSVSGREYPGKVMLPDGRSSEIRQTLAGCLARALPGLIADLKLPTPVSTLEQGLACLLDTMSFMDALPPFRMKQWQVIAVLFIDALSVCRIPGLSPHLTTSRRILIPKVLNGAHISAEEYEIMKELVIPLGRVPQFSMQSGG